jgi:hypothetical protein
MSWLDPDLGLETSSRLRLATSFEGFESSAAWNAHLASAMSPRPATVAPYAVKHSERLRPINKGCLKIWSVYSLLRFSALAVDIEIIPMAKFFLEISDGSNSRAN